ncbi:hypothetical protein LQW54_001115 [Pestalotiopsis sp. IQ-011]
MAETRTNKKWIAMFRCYWRREERRFALLAFRDTVLLLRDLVNSPAGIRYLPVRGLWDTGSDVYLISRNILQRANIGDEDLEHVADKTTLHGIGGAVFAPEWKVQLTWHVKRNMNSRQDTFYVADDISCDMLVPSTLNVGSRYTGIAERDQERKKDEAASSAAEAAARKKMDERRQARLREIQERQQNANRTPAPETFLCICVNMKHFI